MTAHFNKQTQCEQSLTDHSRNAAELTGFRLAAVRFRYTGYFTGLLHDLGKGTERFNAYIHAPDKYRRGEIHHAPSGAIFVYERWYLKAKSPVEKLAAQIIAMVIYGHHGGLMDVIAQNGEELLKNALGQDKRALGYDEAVANFLAETAKIDELDELFKKSVDEVSDFSATLRKSCRKERIRLFISLLSRLLLSALVDSDRFDSACFEYSADPFAARNDPDWSAALAALDNKLAGFPCANEIDRIRKKISDECFTAAKKDGNVFRLTVPTGGGKTFSSLRFAPERAVSHKNVNRIFYVIPFNTILDQNARDIRGALGNTIDILENHSNVIFDADDSDGFEEYTRLTERWDADLVLTSMVRFMDSIYGKSNTDARRMSALIGSVLIFDEVQALPITCRALFECAVDFLTEFCGCTVVLCTATQPVTDLDNKPEEITGDVERLFSSMKRVNIHDETQKMLSAEDAAERLSGLIGKYGSLLMIVNTKPMARKLYELMKDRVTSVHLSTGMYPEHRLRLIDRIKSRDKSKPFFCVSTSLIEAGINISFPCVVRSLAGLGSILQAAGRCNRNGECDRGEVFVWQLDENLRNLPEIKAAAEITRGLLVDEENIGSLENINIYFERERDKLPEMISKFSDKRIGDFKKLVKFPLSAINSETTIFDLLSTGFGRNSAKNEFALNSAFRTAGENFHVIDSLTRGVLVPEGRGAEILAELCGELSYDKTKLLLREAGQYSVSIYSGMFNYLREQKALIYLENVGLYALRDGWYDDETGIMTAVGEMSFLGF